MADMVTFKLLKRSGGAKHGTSASCKSCQRRLAPKLVQWSDYANNVLSLDKDSCAAYMEEDHTLCIYSRRTIYLRDLPSAPGMLDKLMEKIDACRFPSAVSSVRADLPLMDGPRGTGRADCANSAARQAADAAAAQMRSLEQQLARAAEVAAAQAAGGTPGCRRRRARSAGGAAGSGHVGTAKTDKSLISSSTPRPGALAVPMPPPPPPAAQTGMTEEDGPP